MIGASIDKLKINLADTTNKNYRIRFSLISCFFLIGISHVFAQNLLEQKNKTIKVNKQKYEQVEGFIEVLENYESPGSKKIKIPVRIIKSNSDAPKEPIFYLDGGPGYSNIGVPDNTELLETHDFVYVGYRGAEGTHVLNTKKLYKVFKGRKDRLLSDESLDAMVNTMGTYFEGLDKKGIDVNQYTMVQVLDDIENTRKALGYSKINILSFSYGTRLALLFSYRYPQSIHRIVMAGVNPPGHFLWYPQKTEEIIMLWDEIYKSESKGSLKVAMDLSFENMPKKWFVYKLDADKIKTATFLSMTNSNMAVMVFDSYFRAAYKGDYSGLYVTQLLYDIFMKKVIWGDMYSKGASADLQQQMDYREMLRSSGAGTTLGPNMSLVLWGSIGAWDLALIPEEFRSLRVTETETLVLSGNLDTATPAHYASDELMEYLPNGKQIILENFSHADLLLAQPENYQKLIKTYFESGKVDASVFTPRHIDLKPKKKLYRFAKWGFPVVMVLGWLH